SGWRGGGRRIRPEPRRSRRAKCRSGPGIGARRSRSSARAATARAAWPRSALGAVRCERRLGERDLRAVLPDALEGVEDALLLVLHVDHDVVVVKQHPAALVLALPPPEGGACLLELDLHNDVVV